MKNYTFEQKQLLKEQQRKRKERRNKRILGLLTFIIASLLITPLYMKANRIRECAIYSIEDNIIVVRHPNDKLYSFTVNNPELFEEDTMITVIFDELTDWDKNYIAKGVKSK